MAATVWIMQLYIDKSDNSNNLVRVIIDSIEKTQIISLLLVWVGWVLGE